MGQVIEMRSAEPLTIPVKAKEWKARIYKYGDGQKHNPDRYELFVNRNYDGLEGSVGGAFRTYRRGTLAFLCFKEDQKVIGTPEDAIALSGGLFVWAPTQMEAFTELKRRFPDPELILGTTYAILSNF